MHLFSAQACESVEQCQKKTYTKGDVAFMGEKSILHYTGYLLLSYKNQKWKIHYAMYR